MIGEVCTDTILRVAFPTPDPPGPGWNVTRGEAIRFAVCDRLEGPRLFSHVLLLACTHFSVAARVGGVRGLVAVPTPALAGVSPGQSAFDHHATGSPASWGTSARPTDVQSVFDQLYHHSSYLFFFFLSRIDSVRASEVLQ